MAATVEMNQPHPQERDGTIPVFTVLKNGSILKNIFIVNKEPPQSHPIASIQDFEDVLLVGRHPDCNIVLAHPSISRFHLQIHSKPSSQKLSVVDLSSVHGTWVSERKLEPGVSLELKEGDALRIGASSRVYRLHWVPLSLAYDLENPFVSELDVVLEADKNEEEDAVPEEEVDVVQNVNFCPVEIEEIQSVDSVLECINSLFSDENLDATVKKEIPVPKDMISFCCDEERKSPSKDETFGVLDGPFGTETSCLPANSDSENKLCDFQNEVLSPPFVESVVEYYNTPKIEACPEVEMPRETNLFSTLREYLTESICLPVMEAVQGTKVQQFQAAPDTFTSQLPLDKQETSSERHWSSLPINTDPASFDEKGAAAVAVIATVRDDDRVNDISTTGTRIFNSENTFFLVGEAIPDTKFQQIKIVEEVAVDSVSDGEKQDKCGEEYKPKLQVYMNAKSCHEQGHSLDEIVQDIGNKCTGNICPISLRVESVNSKVPQEAVITHKKENQTLQSLVAVAGCSQTEILESHVEATEKNSTFGNIWSRRGKAASAPQIRTSKSRFKSTANVDTAVEMSNEKAIINKTMSKDLFSVLDGEEEEDIFTPDKENLSPNTLRLRFLKKKGELEEIKNSKSQRSMDLFSVLDEEEEEIFTPDKENFSPNTLHLQFLKKKGKLEEIKQSTSQSLHNSKANYCPNIYPDESMSPTSNKENQTPKVAQEKKSRRKPLGSHINLAQEQDNMTLKNRMEKVPFQSLINSGGKSRSGTSGPVSDAKSIDASNCGQVSDKHTNPSHINGERKRSWDMVVDTASLLNKESRKALQLLQGLKGTRLIIPRLVIRELDGMKRQYRIFRRVSEASLVLEWIEECMVKTKWWIHIQSSMEEHRMIAPTPPTSPQTLFSEESWTFPGGIGSWQTLSSPKSSMEIASPTVEDHILDCALLYRRNENDGQLVLLSDDVTLKIKSMAEGLLCETVQEFRESLVNPFSERFLWAKSSPRGLTWSCQDDEVLREKYCRLPLRKSSKGEGARGLKLILLHNSQHGHRQIRSTH